MTNLGQEDVESTPCNMGQRASWDDLPLDELRRLKVHTFSGVAHIASKRDPTDLCVWRRTTKNYGARPRGIELCRHANLHAVPQVNLAEDANMVFMAKQMEPCLKWRGPKDCSAFRA